MSKQVEILCAQCFARVVSLLELPGDPPDPDARQLAIDRGCICPLCADENTAREWNEGA